MLHYALMTKEQIEEAMEILSRAIWIEDSYGNKDVAASMQLDYDKLSAIWRVK